MRAAIYARVSTAGKGQNPDLQVGPLHQWSSAHSHVKKTPEPIISVGCYLTEEIKDWPASFIGHLPQTQFQFFLTLPMNLP